MFMIHKQDLRLTLDNRYVHGRMFTVLVPNCLKIYLFCIIAMTVNFLLIFFKLCCFDGTSRNSQDYDFIVIAAFYSASCITIHIDHVILYGMD